MDIMAGSNPTVLCLFHGLKLDVLPNDCSAAPVHNSIKCDVCELYIERNDGCTSWQAGQFVMWFEHAIS